MDAPPVIPSTEDAICAFLEYLVDPALTSEVARGDAPDPSHQKSVAKQMHAVVVLYNYFHRQKHPDLKYVDFESFCQLIVVLRPALSAFMKPKQSSGSTQTVEERALLGTAIMDACNICRGLDASLDSFTIASWPVSKVVILFVDSKKENCYLKLGTVTEGVWSPIEKAIVASDCSSRCTFGGNYIGKRKRIARQESDDGIGDDDDTFFRKLAFSTVEEATGTKQKDLIIVESHLIYSLDKRKTSARFYIMQCTVEDSVDNMVPLKDILNSLQGPLLRTSISSKWIVTSAVEYFHVLPYLGILSDWLSRDTFSKECKEKLSGIAHGNLQECSTTKTMYISEAEKSLATFLVNSTPSTFGGAPKSGNANGGQPIKPFVDIHGPSEHNVDDIITEPQSDGFSNTSYEPQSDGFPNPSYEPQSDGFLSTTANTKQVDNLQTSTKLMNSNVKKADSRAISYVEHMKSFGHNVDGTITEHQGDGFLNTTANKKQVDNPQTNTKLMKSHGKKAAFKAISYAPQAKVVKPCSNVIQGVGQDKDSKISKERVDNDSCTLSLAQANDSRLHLERLGATVVSKGPLLSEAALKALLSKRDTLTLKLRDIEDDIAMCDHNIKTIMRADEDNFAMKIDTIIDYLGTCPRSTAQEAASWHLHLDECWRHCIRSKKLSEAVLGVQDQCKELDATCYTNGWILPTYRVTSSNGGFQATATVKGADFVYSADGDTESNPSKARESAAAYLLMKLRSNG